ncbi:MAG TPA: hypothetical protein VM510_01560, partial [Caulifigura sp.]|nr:hypothetical protein [Caulifigura sp.]
VPWSRGRKRVTVRLKTTSRELTQLVRVTYAPAAPRLQWQPAWNPKDEVKTSDVVVEAAIQPSTEPFEARLLLHRPGTAEPTVLKTWTGREPLTIKESLNIVPGENRIELDVWNAGVQDSDRPNESARQVAVVRRAIPEAPVIQIDSVQSITADGKQSPIESDQLVYKSTQPQFRIQGRIDATDNLTTASLESAAPRRDLASFQPGSARQLAFNELITLEPGKTDVVLRSSVGDRAAERRISLAFIPQVPTIREFKADVTTIKKIPDTIAGYLDNVLFEGYHEPAVVLTARLEGNLAQPYALELQANDQKVDAAQLETNRSNPAEHVVTVRLPLQGGRQSFSLKATNAWTAEESQKQVDLEFRRPPSISEINLPERLAGAPLDFRARVHSTLPLRAARLTIDDSIEVPNVRFEPIEGTPNAWLVSADKIGLAEGEHQLQLSVANDDGLALEPATRSFKMDRPPVAPPRLAITEPSARDASLTVASPRLEIEYRAETKAPVGVQIEIRGNAQRLEQTQIAVPDAEAKDGILVHRHPLDLFEGVNEITLQAHNEGGFSEKVVLRVAYVPAAATVEIVALGDLRPKVRNDGTGYFSEAAAKSYLPLKGRVKLNDPAMAKRQMSARIWVNNFKLPTVPVSFDESQPGIGAFSSDVVFNQPTKNKIRVELFSSDGRIASELGCTNELLVDCQKPDQKQELYLLLLGTGNGEETRDKAKSLLQAKALTTQQASQEVWSNGAFSRIYVHDAMNVPPAAVQNRLRELIGKMHNNLRSGQQNNLQSVVMVLFQGKITLQADDFSLTTAATAGTRALTGRILEEYLTRTYGAHLILLDLIDSEQGLRNKDIWPKAPHLGIELFSWNGKGDKPKDLSLISMLGESLTHSRLVRDLAVDLDRKAQLVENEYPGQTESVNLLKDIYDLRIGGGQ